MNDSFIGVSGNGATHRAERNECRHINGRPGREKIGRDLEQTMDEGGGWSDGGSSSLKRRKIDPPTAETEAEAEEVIYSAPEEEAPSSLSATTTSTKSSRSSSLSPPPDEEEGDEEDEGVDVDVEVPLRRLVPPPNPDDWSAVVARARSHPREAAESYFDPATPPFVDRDDDPRAASACHRCRPLHAMLLHDPPPPAVEAVLRAHPEAVLDATTFGGTTALRIAAERTPGAGGVGPALPPRLQVLRLLLVAELAMAKKGERERERRRLRRRGGGGDAAGMRALLLVRAATTTGDGAAMSDPTRIQSPSSVTIRSAG